MQQRHAFAQVEPLDFTTPDADKPNHFADAFKDTGAIGRRWIKSGATKDGVEDSIAKYNGEWKIDTPEKLVLKNDYALILTVSQVQKCF